MYIALGSKSDSPALSLPVGRAAEWFEEDFCFYWLDQSNAKLTRDKREGVGGQHMACFPVHFSCYDCNCRRELFLPFDLGDGHSDLYRLAG